MERGTVNRQKDKNMLLIITITISSNMIGGLAALLFTNRVIGQLTVIEHL